MKHLIAPAFSILAASTIFCAFETASAAEAQTLPNPQQVQQFDPDVFLGTWRDDQNRFWFTIDEIVGSEIRAAQFWLAHLKEGRIEGNSLTLISQSCVRFIGCYEYTHVAELVGPDSMDMRGESGICVFDHGCRDEGDVVNHLLMRD